MGSVSCLLGKYSEFVLWWPRPLRQRYPGLFDDLLKPSSPQAKLFPSHILPDSDDPSLKKCTPHIFAEGEESSAGVAMLSCYVYASCREYAREGYGISPTLRSYLLPCGATTWS